MVKALRKVIIVQTQKAIERESAASANGTSYDLKSLLEKQRRQPCMNYRYDELQLRFVDATHNTLISVEKIDSIDMGLRMKTYGYNPAILNMVFLFPPLLL